MDGVNDEMNIQIMTIMLFMASIPQLYVCWCTWPGFTVHNQYDNSIQSRSTEPIYACINDHP